MKRFLATVLASITLLPAVHAQGVGYPDRPIRIVVPYTPGGASDAVARLVGKGLSAELGQPVIVDNKPGASATIGTGYVANQAPDGYTLGLVAAQFVTNRAVGIKEPYDSLRDLAPVINVAWMPILVAANPKVPAKDLPSLIRWIRSQSNPVMYSSPGAGSLTQLWGELLAQRLQLQLVHVPYKGSAGAAQAVMAGDVPLMFDVAGITTTMIREGKLNGIATPGTERPPGLPEVSTARESGVKDLDAASFLGLVAPARTPPAVLARLNAAANKVLRSKEYVDAVNGLGMSPAGGSAEDFGRMLAAETARWTAVARDAGIKAAP
ncbi:tripartite tricarboxylate transporter substrate-binding protein [Xenophilus arseniciresistens]|uniref:Tripartite tricarboxylate transporter substrate-binding protein n=1 Tax=Xenophilus arseniciresistens TaxID=1283306 RepID=A0AAE3N698_9BURK|nr:tripartite tricarboxylate transporter substrate-binding protein [Xenophilus arseniciresistens]MDA7416026.1 tripartite tricarboxylate transporter substrate-binding protein [Xenophilus arseniciresistens]